MKKLKPAALILYLPDGGTTSVLHFNTGDAIAINSDHPDLEKGKPYPILSYSHTPDGPHVCIQGKTNSIYRVHNEYQEGESREYFLKKIRGGITEFCLPQVQKEIVFHPAPLMTVSWVNPETPTLPVIHGDAKNAA